MKIKPFMERLFSRAYKRYIVVRTYSTLHNDGWYVVGLSDWPKPIFFKESYKPNKWIYIKNEDITNTLVFDNLYKAKDYLKSLLYNPFGDALEIWVIKVKRFIKMDKLSLFNGSSIECEWWEWLKLRKCVASIYQNKNVKDIVNA